MAIFTDADLQDLADLTTDLLMKDICQIKRKATATSDNKGGRSVTWTTASTPACALVDDQNRPIESVKAQQVTSEVPMFMLLPKGTDVTGKDRLVHNSVTYQIIAVRPAGSYEVVRKLPVVFSSLD